MERLIAQFKALPLWQRAFLIAVLPLILSIYVYMMLLSPALDERDKLKKDVEGVKVDIERIKSSINPKLIESLKKQQEELEREYIRKSAELKNLVGEIPTEKEIGKVIKDVGRIAQKSRVIILSMQISNPEKVQYYMEGEKNLVKVYKPQQTQAQQQAQQTPSQVITLLKSDVRLSILGDYISIKNFLEALKEEGIVSYPVEINLYSDGHRIKVDLTLHTLFNEEGRL